MDHKFLLIIVFLAAINAVVLAILHELRKK